MVRALWSGALLALRRLRSRVGLLALLLALALVLVQGVGVLSVQLFSGGAGFTGMTLGICGAEEEDDLTRKLVSMAAAAAGVEDYCTLEAVAEQEGRKALEEGDITALLILPEGLVESVLNGENKPVTLLTNANQPLESWLIRQIGQSVSRMLAAAQAGIYTVLDEYDRSELAEPDREDVLLEINLAYLSWVSGREKIYDTLTVSPTGGSLPVTEHYALSVLVYLPLLCSALVWPAFGGKELMGWYRRLRSAGVDPKQGALGGVLACWLVLLPLVWLPLVFGGGAWLSALGGAALVSLGAASFCGLCCVLTPSPGGGALLSFVLGTGMLILSGGVLPVMLLPVGLRGLADWMPLDWARTVLSGALGWEVTAAPLGALMGVTGVLMALTALLFERRVLGEEGSI